MKMICYNQLSHCQKQFNELSPVLSEGEILHQHRVNVKEYVLNLFGNLSKTQAIHSYLFIMTSSRVGDSHNPFLSIITEFTYL